MTFNTWQEFKEKALRCQNTKAFTARESTIPGDEAIFITEDRLGQPSTTFRITPATWQNIRNTRPEYLRVLESCRLRGIDLGVGLERATEAAQGAANPFFAGAGAVLAIALIIALKD